MTLRILERIFRAAGHDYGPDNALPSIQQDLSGMLRDEVKRDACPKIARPVGFSF